MKRRSSMARRFRRGGRRRISGCRSIRRPEDSFRRASLCTEREVVPRLGHIMVVSLVKFESVWQELRLPERLLLEL